VQAAKRLCMCLCREVRVPQSRHCDGTQALPEEEVPELQRTNLTQAVLQLKAIGIDSIMAFPFLDPPPAEAAVRALERHYALGAIHDDAKCASGSMLCLPRFHRWRRQSRLQEVQRYRTHCVVAHCGAAALRRNPQWRRPIRLLQADSRRRLATAKPLPLEPLVTPLMTQVCSAG
jgi:HrpA-like RNA helicase